LLGWAAGGAAREADLEVGVEVAVILLGLGQRATRPAQDVRWIRVAPATVGHAELARVVDDSLEG